MSSIVRSTLMIITKNVFSYSGLDYEIYKMVLCNIFHDQNNYSYSPTVVYTMDYMVDVRRYNGNIYNMP